MEWIVALIIYSLSETIKDNQAEINHLQDDLLVLQGAHSSLHARQRVDHDTHHKKIDLNKDHIELLESRLDSLSDQIEN